MAEEINSELQGPIYFELGAIFFNMKTFEPAIDMLEKGMLVYLELPAEAEEADAKHLLQLFVMLTESYFNAKEFKRGIAFLQKFLEQCKGRKEYDEVYPPLALSIGEFYYASGEYNKCIETLEQGSDKASQLSSDLAILYYYYLAWAHVKAEKHKESVEHIEKYLSYAQSTKAPPESLMESFMSLVISYKELGQIDESIKTVDRAVTELSKLDATRHPLLCLKHYYFLGLFCLNKLEQHEQARSLLEKAYSLSRTHAGLSAQMPWGTIAVDLAEAYHKLKNREKALEMIDTGLAHLKDKDLTLVTPTLIRKAKIHSELADKQSALQALEAALKVSEELKEKEEQQPQRPEETTKPAESQVSNFKWMYRFVKYQLGKMYTLMGHLSKGNKELHDALGLFDEEAEPEIKIVILGTIASNFAQTGKREEAQQYLEQVETVLSRVTKEINQGDIRTEIAETLLFLDDLHKAEKEFEEVSIS